MGVAPWLITHLKRLGIFPWKTIKLLLGVAPLPRVPLLGPDKVARPGPPDAVSATRSRDEVLEVQIMGTLQRGGSWRSIHPATNVGLKRPFLWGIQPQNFHGWFPLFSSVDDWRMGEESLQLALFWGIDDAAGPFRNDTHNRQTRGNRHIPWGDRPPYGFWWPKSLLNSASVLLVGGLSLWKIWKSIGMMTFPIYGKIKNGNKPPTRLYVRVWGLISSRCC